MTENTPTILDYYRNIANMTYLTAIYAVTAQTEFLRLFNEHRLANLNYSKANWDACDRFWREATLDLFHLRKGA
jgi:hypothetical protein